EIGMSGGQDPGCRACMIWDETKQNKELFTFVKNLIELRKNVPAFGNDSTFKILAFDNQSNTLIYQKQSRNRKILFVINNSSKKQAVHLPDFQKSSCSELLIGKDSETAYHSVPFEKEQIKVPPMGFRIFEYRI